MTPINVFLAGTCWRLWQAWTPWRAGTACKHVGITQHCLLLAHLFNSLPAHAVTHCPAWSLCHSM